MRVRRRGTISLAQMKMPASYALASEEMTNLIIFAIVRIGPLILGAGTFSDIMMCASA